MDQADIPGEHPLWNTSIQNKYRQSLHRWRSSLKLIAVVEKTWAFSLVNKRLWLTALLRCTATTATESLASRLARRRAGMTLKKTRDIQRYVQLKVSACNKFSSILKRRCVWICLNRFFSRETPWPLWSYSRYRPFPSVSYQTDKVRTRLLFGKRIYRTQFLRYSQTCQSTTWAPEAQGTFAKRAKASDGVSYSNSYQHTRATMISSKRSELGMSLELVTC